MPLPVPQNAGSTQNRCSVRIILLNKEELVISVDNKNAKVGDLYSKACEHLGIKETEYFGLAQQRDGEFQFLQLDKKLQKLASKLFKSKNELNNKPMLSFYLRVQYYVDNIGLLRDRTTRHLYYLQLCDNLLHYGQMVSEEKCFILASYALQSDFGSFKQDVHVGAYFNPDDYFPAWVIMRRGEDYITNNLPVMHKDLTSMTQADARVAFIRELSSSPISHNFHFYRLKKRKYDSVPTIWLAIGPKGLEIHEEVNGFKNQLSVFLWQNIEKIHCDKRKFEIVTDVAAERKFTYYVVNKEWGDHLLDLCRSTHKLQIALQPRLMEMRHQEAQDQLYREMYIHGGNLRSSWEHQRQLGTPDHRQPSLRANHSSDVDGNGLTTVPENAVAMMPNEKDEVDDDDDGGREILIVSPPLMSSTLTTISPMSDHLQSSFWSYANDQINPKPSFGYDGEPMFQRMPSFGNPLVSRGTGSFISKRTVSSSSKPDSSMESLMSGLLNNSSSPSFGRTHPTSPHPDRSESGNQSDAKSWLASSVNSTPTWQSASPSSSVGSSQLVLSLPPRQTFLDAALLRKSLPHGTSLQEYISRIISGEETKSALPPLNSQMMGHRKSSLDQQNICLSLASNDLLSRSVSLRQPKEMPNDKQNIANTKCMSRSAERAIQFSLEPEDAATTVATVQHLPQIPVTAQMQKIIFPEKMTAISMAVRPMMGGMIRENVDVEDGHFAKAYLPENAVSGVFHPMHSTPLQSRYQRPQIYHANIPLSYNTSMSLANASYDPSQTLPNFAFPATPVITATETDYKSGTYFQPILGYAKTTTSGLSVIGQTAVASSWPLNASSQQHLAHESLLPIYSDPPPYHEWEAAHGKTVPNVGSPERRLTTAATQLKATEPDRTTLTTEQQQPQSGLTNNVVSHNSFLSLSPYLHPVYSNQNASHAAALEAEKRLTELLQDVTPPSVCNDCSVPIVDGSNGCSSENDIPSSYVNTQNHSHPLAESAHNGSTACQEIDSHVNIREKLQNFGSQLPMLNALLKDKSLLNFRLNGKTAECSGGTEALAVKLSDVAVQPDLQQQNCNGVLRQTADTAMSEKLMQMLALHDANGQLGKLGQTPSNGLRYHSSEVVATPLKEQRINHGQSQSDSAALWCNHNVNEY